MAMSDMSSTDGEMSVNMSRVFVVALAAVHIAVGDAACASALARARAGVVLIGR